MADFRSVQTRMWREDEWFDELPDNDARLLWMYLFTNPSAPMTGLYRLTIRAIASETHISKDRVRELLELFARDGKAFYEHGIIFVTNMQRLQFDKVSPNMARRMQKDIDAIKDCRLKQLYLQNYGYPAIVNVDGKDTVVYEYPNDEIERPEHSLSIPYRQTIDRGDATETETVTETEQKQRRNRKRKQPGSAQPSNGLLMAYTDASGETANHPDKFKTWFHDITGRYTEADCQRAFKKLRLDIAGDKLAGRTKWEHTIWLLENPPEPTPQSKYEQFIDGINMDAGYVD